MCPLGASSPEIFYDPCGIRTRVTAVKGRCLNPLTNGPYETPQAGLEPATLRLTAGCSAIELLRIIILAPSKLNTSESFYSLSSLEHFVNNFFIIFHFIWSSPRSISIGQLNTLLCLHLQPINLVIFKGSYSIKDGKSYLEGGFTLRCLQRLSVPYIATQLCSWSATGTPEVRPSRSSRTKDSSSQISCAHNG